MKTISTHSRFPIGSAGLFATTIQTCAVTLLAIATPSPVIAETVDTTLVALKGSPVPGEPTGTIYKGFGTPSLDGDDVDFLATIKGPEGSQKVVVLGTPGSVVLRTGDAAPGAGAATFKAFKDPVFSDGRYAVVAKIAATDNSVNKDNDTGIWSTATGPLRHVAREGLAAPGTNGAVFKSFTSVALPQRAGIVAGARPANGVALPTERGAFFVARLASGGGNVVDSTNDVGLWREISGIVPTARQGNVAPANFNAELLLREGNILDVGKGSPDLRTVKAFTCIKAVSGSPGHGRNFAFGRVNARVVFTDGTQAIIEFAENSPAFTVIQKTGDPISPSANSPVFKKFGIPAFYESASNYMFVASLKSGGGGITPGNDTGIFDFEPGGFALAPVVTEGDPAAGTPGYFYKFKDPAPAYENLAFVASLYKNVPGVDATNDYGLWKGASHNPIIPLTLVAREGSEGPGITGSAIKSFAFYAMPERNVGPLFTAKLVIGTGGVTAADAFALWANIGAVGNENFLLVRQGHPLDASGNTYGVRTITALKAVSGSPGQARAYNSTGGVTYKAKLNGGLEGIFRVQVPAPPIGQ